MPDAPSRREAFPQSIDERLFLGIRQARLRMQDQIVFASHELLISKQVAGAVKRILT
jgi:hypothetical protein